MALEYLVNRFKALFVIILGVFRRAMCCLRRRRRSSCDSIPLSAVGVVSDGANGGSADADQWDRWEEESPVIVVSDKPSDVIRTKIQQYRQQQFAKPRQAVNDDDDDDGTRANFFEDMTPTMTKQTTIVIREKRLELANCDPAKFAVAMDRIPTNELGAWEDDATSWENETVQEFGDPTQQLREQKRQERQRRIFEQQQRRIEYNYRPQPLGEKITS